MKPARQRGKGSQCQAPWLYSEFVKLHTNCEVVGGCLLGLQAIEMCDPKYCCGAGSQEVRREMGIPSEYRENALCELERVRTVLLAGRSWRNSRMKQKHIYVDVWTISPSGKVGNSFAADGTDGG